MHSAILRNGILTETIAGVTDILGRELDAIAVERAVIGLYFTGVKLTGGVAGTCATPRDAGPGDVCCPISAHRVAFRRLAGRPAAELMRASVDTSRARRHQVYRRAGQPCPRCRTPIRSWGQGDGNRISYWCPVCQVGTDPQGA